MSKVNDDVENIDAPVEAGKFRTILPQVLAVTVKNFLLLDLGLSLAFPTIVIPALTGASSELNPNEILFITAAQASWLGSIMYIFEPLGSVMSGWITEPIGRKRAMFIVNLPNVIAWAMLYYSTTLAEVLIALIFLGLGVGLMEAPIITYVGEICQASIRGILIGLSGIAATFGLFLVFLLGSITDWRTVALCCLAVPVSTMVFVCLIPETPLWLLSKNRTEDARKSLQWLRGWVSPKAVEKEFTEIQRYSEFTKACIECSNAKQKCTHPPPTVLERLRELIRKRTLKPFIIVTMSYFFCQFSGFIAMRPYIVLIFKVYGTPIDPNQATVWLGVAGVLGTVTCVSTVKFVGKRGLFIGALFGVFISDIGLSIYGFIHLPAGSTTFSPPYAADEQSHFPLAMCSLMSFATAVGVTSVPPMLLSELFPFKTRGVATGIAGAANFLMQFIATKTYLSLESIFTLPGISAFYAVICVIGLILGFFIIPETERRTLEDIEFHFSKNDRSLLDRKISKDVIAKNLVMNDADHERSILATISEESSETVSDVAVSAKACEISTCD